MQIFKICINFIFFQFFYAIIIFRIEVRFCMTEKIMQDNFLYLQEWNKYNPQLQDALFIEEGCLICKIAGKLEKVDIHDFYLPDILYNEDLRKDVSNTLAAEDLFRIIRVYATSQKFRKEQQQELLSAPAILHIWTQQNVLYMEDDLGRKYKYTTPHPEKVLQIYGILKAQKKQVTVDDLTKELKNKKKRSSSKDYYDLISQEVPLTFEEQKFIKEFENHIADIKRFSLYFPEQIIEEEKNYETFYSTASLLPQISSNLQEGIKRSQELLAVPSLAEERITKENSLNLERTRSLKAEQTNGYINGTALVFVVINLGLFLACLLLFIE